VVLYAAQLVANALWTWLFFHTGAGAFAEIAILWLLIVATIVTFWRAHTVAGALMLPYLAWVILPRRSPGRCGTRIRRCRNKAEQKCGVIASLQALVQSPHE
jgi:hypothetical protein